MVLSSLTVDLAPSLFRALATSPEEDFTYMAFDKPANVEETVGMVESLLDLPGWSPYAVEVDDDAKGFTSFLRDEPAVGVVEIGSIMFTPALQRTIAATEVIHLMLSHAFEAGYRRVEWKCDDLNEPSRSSAVRFGFIYEGTFAKATHYKGRSRDTAWYAMTDDRWGEVRPAFEAWLKSENFDAAGNQQRSLRELMPGAGERT